ncbi:MAG: hypothetical protein V3R92_00835 [Dehalococcoidales bacterium]
MLKLSGCPRCGGTVLVDRDQYGWYEQCLNCGYEHDLRPVVEIRKPVKSEMRVTGDVGKQKA